MKTEKTLKNKNYKTIAVLRFNCLTILVKRLVLLIIIIFLQWSLRTKTIIIWKKFWYQPWVLRANLKELKLKIFIKKKMFINQWLKINHHLCIAHHLNINRINCLQREFWQYLLEMLSSHNLFPTLALGIIRISRNIIWISNMQRIYMWLLIL